LAYQSTIFISSFNVAMNDEEADEQEGIEQVKGGEGDKLAESGDQTEGGEGDMLAEGEDGDEQTPGGNELAEGDEGADETEGADEQAVGGEGDMLAEGEGDVQADGGEGYGNPVAEAMILGSAELVIGI
jgi:hypothetical protein